MRGRPAPEPYAADRDRKVYVTPAYYELTYGRNERTVRDWARNKRVRSMWSGDTFYVHLADCRALDKDTPKQERSTKAASIPRL